MTYCLLHTSCSILECQDIRAKQVEFRALPGCQLRDHVSVQRLQVLTLPEPYAYLSKPTAISQSADRV